MKINDCAIYKGSAKPVNLYQGAHKIAGWKWDEQTVTDMAFEDSYHDRMDLVALGRSRQDGAPSPDNPAPIASSAGAIRAEDRDGDGVWVDMGILRAIPDGAGGWAARDTLEVVGGRWRLTQRVGRIALDGSEAYGIFDHLTMINTAGFIFHNLEAGWYARGAVCTHFVRRGSVTQDAVGFSAGDNSARVYFRVPRSLATTAIEFKAWLAAEFLNGTPVAIEHELAIPIVHDLGPADLPSYYPFTRVLVGGDYPPDVVARCRVVDAG